MIVSVPRWYGSQEVIFVARGAFDAWKEEQNGTFTHFSIIL